MKIYIGSDHAGFEAKSAVIKHLQKKHEVVDCGTNSTNSVNYVDFASCVAYQIKKDISALGIVICGTGIGVSIACNKVDNIRCALIYNNEVAISAKEHNNANVLAFGSRQFSNLEINTMIDKFMDASFIGGRHELRIKSINEIKK